MSGLCAALFAGLALLFGARLLAFRQDTSGDGGSTDRGVDASHGVMSLGMAAMFWPWSNPIPALFWQVLFSIMAAWFAVRLLRRGVQPVTIPQPGPDRAADLHHVLGSLAMVYMLAGIPAGQHTAHGTEVAGPGIALPVLAWTFVAYFLVFAVWLGARLVKPVNTVAVTATGAALLGDGPRSVAASPHLLGSSRIVMGIGMSYMLVTML
ncbi:MAG: DUF5134 domain-containing protein [Actinomycetota bacterium]|nr:DUF5134 domain-containing protein [Actinomycetota bacterium]